MRLAIIFILVFLLGCRDQEFKALAYVPTYFDALDFSSIRTLPPQPIVQQGTIVQSGNYLFVNDKKRGIHVIDNTVPGNPSYIYFWNIPGNQTFNFRDGFLYADNGPHMLVINISDFGNIKFEMYIEGVFFKNMKEQFPEFATSGEFFVCPDPEKGLVKSWNKEIVENPNCEKI
ncbi:LVIVD repeat-containing protein [Portibacter marinus]|uniref:hypothetical protein n=1 Tax=Portibacter marinus TaxID=2898660 RepID=UPI001F278F77|nr:hypothetical protein [Portibacter marinus]